MSLWRAYCPEPTHSVFPEDVITVNTRWWKFGVDVDKEKTEADVIAKLPPTIQIAIALGRRRDDRLVARCKKCGRPLVKDSLVMGIVS